MDNEQEVVFERGAFLNKFHLQGKVALVTGGSRGIGLAVTKGIAQQRANIASIARDENRLKLKYCFAAYTKRF